MEASSRGLNSQETTIQRFGKQFIIQHIVLFTSVILLVLTGIPLWAAGRPDYLWWDQSLLASVGFLEWNSWLHRVAGVILTLVSVYHLLYTIFSKEGRREFMELLPYPKDFADVTLNILYFLRLRKEPPRFGRFTYYEKFDYWAVYWGCVIMIGSGTVMWFTHITKRFMPWFTYDLAALVHADEAILAALSLFIWHFYNVHFSPARFPGSLTWLHGRVSEEEMKRHHPLEYERLEHKRETDGEG